MLIGGGFISTTPAHINFIRYKVVKLSLAHASRLIEFTIYTLRLWFLDVRDTFNIVHRMTHNFEGHQKENGLQKCVSKAPIENGGLNVFHNAYQ